MKRLRPEKSTPFYRQLWRVVDGAVADAFQNHPDYLTQRGAKLARRSIAKRVVGAVLGYAEQSVQGRSGLSPAADRGDGVVSVVDRVCVGPIPAEGSFSGPREIPAPAPSILFYHPV